jgi:hypothetical protein
METPPGSTTSPISRSGGGLAVEDILVSLGGTEDAGKRCIRGRCKECMEERRREYLVGGCFGDLGRYGMAGVCGLGFDVRGRLDGKFAWEMKMEWVGVLRSDGKGSVNGAEDAGLLVLAPDGLVEYRCGWCLCCGV